MAQTEISIGDLNRDQAVRIRFCRPDSSWRHVIWTVEWTDGLTVLLRPLANDTFSYGKTEVRAFDADEVMFLDATELLAAYQELSA